MALNPQQSSPVFPSARAAIPLPPHAVYWAEGLLLMPQHFQQSFLRADMVSAYHMQTVSPWAWGVVQCALDERGWSKGQVRVAELEAVLPDGTVVSAPAGPGELSLTLDQSDPTRRSWLVWLVLPFGAERSGDGGAGAELSRYRATDQAGVVDLLGGDGGCTMTRLAPNVRLWVGEGVPPAFCGFPLIRVEKTADGFRADPAYQPPALRLSALQGLRDRCVQLCTTLRAQATRLAEQAGGGISAFAAPPVRDLRVTVGHLGACLPLLEALVLDADPHPFQVYCTLLDLAGRVAVLRDALIPPPFPRYRHDDLMIAFDGVLDFLEQTLDSLGRANRVIRFVPCDGGYQLPADSLTDETLLPQIPGGAVAPLVIAVTCPQGVEDHLVEHWVMTSTLCGAARMEMARSHRLLGLRRERIDRAPELGLEARRGMLLFAVHPDHGWFCADDSLVMLNRGSHGSDRAPGRPEEIVLHQKMGGGDGP